MKFIFWRRFDYEKVYLKSKGCSNSIFVAVNLNFAYQIQILYKHKKSTHLEIFIFFFVIKTFYILIQVCK